VNLSSLPGGGCAELRLHGVAVETLDIHDIWWAGSPKICLFSV